MDLTQVAANPVDPLSEVLKQVARNHNVSNASLAAKVSVADRVHLYWAKAKMLVLLGQ